MPPRNNQNRGGRRRRRGQGNETEDEEGNTIFQSVRRCLQPLLRLLLCLLYAVISAVHILSWIPWVPVLIFFHLASILSVCLQSGVLLLTRVLFICLKSMMLALPWTIWMFMLIQGVDLGCSHIRLTILALPFFMSRRFVRSVRLIANHMWPPWLLRLLKGNWSSTRQPAFVANMVEQNVDNGQHGLTANLISVQDYLDGHPATMPHPSYQFQIPTREGLNLWQGFLDIVINAYKTNKSWAGTFNEEHLRMNGSECRIEMEPSSSATFENLLLDLAQLAALLFGYFETPNQLAPRCIQQLYNTMTTPWLGPIPLPSAQQIEKFLIFMGNHPSLKPARRSSTFLSKVFQARRAMGATERATVDDAVNRVYVDNNWMHDIAPLGYRVLTRAVWFLYNHPDNEVPTYGIGAEELFRFLRNVYEHGGDRDTDGRQLVSDMEDIDYLVAEEFSDHITELVWYLIMSVDMTGILKHAWGDYQ